MPIAGTYSWTEKVDSLKVSIPTKGVSVSKIDIYATSSILKVNYAPYLVNILLKNAIDPVKHKASISNGTLNITLIKQNPGIWGKLELESDGTIQDVAIRKESIAAQEKFEAVMDEKRKSRKVDDERYSLRKQMALNEAERNKLDNLKQEEKHSAESAVYETFAQMKLEEEKKRSSNQPKLIVQSTASSTSSKVPPSTDSKAIFDDGTDFEEFDMDAILENDDIDDERKINAEVESSSEVEEQSDEGDEIKFIPPPRNAGISQSADGKVDIVFTPRVFPTPLRESKAAEEEDWVTKNRRHLKKHGALGQNLTRGNGMDVSEEDPRWLKAKADDFFRSGDIRSALEAYSAAIEADPNMTACYSNRSVCFLKLNMLRDCVMDCSEAIKQLQAEIADADADADADVTSSSSAAQVVKATLVKLLTRRAAAYCSLGLYPEALQDYELAVQIAESKAADCQLSSGCLAEKNLENLISDCERIRLLWNADQLKKLADSLLAEREVAKAAAKYSEALELLPMHVSCLSNRSACKLASGDIQGCITDCSEAIALLEIDVGSTKAKGIAFGGVAGSSSADLNMLAAILPPAGSDKRKSWVLKTVSRRGTAYAQLGLIDEAVADYSLACSLDPANEALKVDLNRIRNYREGSRAPAAVGAVGAGATQPLQEEEPQS